MIEYDQHVCVRDRILPIMQIQGYPMGIPPNATLHTVDGSEIRRSPVEVGRKYPIIYKILYIPTVVGLGISSTKTVGILKNTAETQKIFGSSSNHLNFAGARNVSFREGKYRPC